MLDILDISPTPQNTINTVPCNMHFCKCVLHQYDDLFEDFVYIKECSTVSNTFYVYQAINFRKIKNIFMVSAMFCEIYFCWKFSCIPLSNFISLKPTYLLSS